jgi:WYL domain
MVERFSNSHNPNGLGFSNGVVSDAKGNFVLYSDYEAALRAAVLEVEPVAWQRYSERLGWTIVDADYAQHLAANGEKVRPLYTHHAPRSDMERELAEARAEFEIERIHSKGMANAAYDWRVRAEKTEAERDALAADKARLEESLARLTSEANAIALEFVYALHDRDGIWDALKQARAALSGASIPAHDDSQPVRLTYTNWRGETSERTITPLRVYYGSTDWHPEPQWLLRAFDHDKQAERDFALKDFGPAPADKAEERREALEEAAKRLYWQNVLDHWPAEWTRDVEAVTEIGTYTISVDQPAVGGTCYLWLAGNETDEHDSEHRTMLDAKSAATADYRSRAAAIRSLISNPAREGE